MKGTTGSNEKREIKGKGKGRGTWNKGVICVPHCGSALLATILTCPSWPPHSKKLAPPLTRVTSQKVEEGTAEKMSLQMTATYADKHNIYGFLCKNYVLLEHYCISLTWTLTRTLIHCF